MFNLSLKQFKKIYKQKIRQIIASQRWRSKSLRRQIYGLFYLILIIVLFLWNWPLFLATLSGIGIMILTYLSQEWDWEKYYTELSIWLKTLNFRLIGAVSMGGLSAFLIYLMITIWLTADNHWWATGAILQGLIILLIAGLLFWKNTYQPQLKHQQKFEILLDDLTSTNQLKRLIAIRKLTNLFRHNSLNRNQRKQLNDYFQIMLTHEQEIILQRALLEGLEEINFTAQPLAMPLNITEKVRLKSIEKILDYEIN